MKKLVSILLVTLMCCGLLVGCGGDSSVYKLPHNEEVGLNASSKDIVKKDHLVELTKEHPSYEYLNQISDSYENAEEEFGTQYVKEEGEKVLINGYEFSLSYVIHKKDGLKQARYRGSNIDESGKKELLDYLTEKYGEEIKNSEFALYSEYHEIKVEDGEKKFVIEFGIPQNFQDELWIVVIQSKM